MFQKLDAVEKRYDELTAKISDPEVIANQSEWQKYMKEHASLVDIVEKYREYKLAKSNFEEAKEMLNDKELKELAELEMEELRVKIPKLEEELKILLIPKDPDDDKNIICEIRAGAGGDEAALFAGTLYRMYSMYAETKHWKIDVLNENETGLGGYKEITFMITGKGVYSRLKFESGVHRVQRVPDTESSGRIHTSTATVAVLPVVEDVEIEINPADIKMEVFRASGAGGQHVNKTSSAVRLIHEPTGIVAECQTAGRGRLGREFVSPKKSGIYLSVIYAPENGIQEPAKLTAFSAVAVCRTLKKLFNLDAQIKWVNDVFLNGKKVSGILTEGIVNFETRKIEAAIVGIGLNIFENNEFSAEIKQVAGSIFQCENDVDTEKKVSRIKIAAQIAGETLSIFSEDSQKVINEYREKSFLIGKKVFVHPVIVNNEVYEATVLDIDQNAALVVKTLDGTIKSLNSGEVSIKSESVINRN